MVILKERTVENKFEDTPLLQAFYTSFGFAVLNLFGWYRELLIKFGIEKRKGKEDPESVNLY